MQRLDSMATPLAFDYKRKQDEAAAALERGDAVSVG